MTWLTEEENKKFLGDGSRNAQGQTLEKFLEAYDPTKYKCPCNTVDMMVFRNSGPFTGDVNALKLLLVQRRNHPCIGCWATPGGFVEIGEDLDAAALRELREETSGTGIPMIQLHTYGDMTLDPRWRIITTSYLALIEQDIPVKAADDAADACWFSVHFEEVGDGRCTLDLTNKERGIHLRSLLQHEVIRHSILTDDRFTLIDGGGLSADHPVLIADALSYLSRAGKQRQQ